ncbi:hypothetical protein [Novosphingobium mathurense]|uniref:Uncharacterized protein n=1 Tax=Novosphingobium mathurense TaxID=428990 RepID=A0A1U6H640_9SPHN|nr:hypothetical protein [Novosphingobium mathurense]SLJ91228.1 hypothetical protein SAMN06295987_1011342 [Novosphingobium mathurense]
MKHRIVIHQTYRVERRIAVEIDAPNAACGCEMLASGAIDIPSFDDPRWIEFRTLEHEDYRPV